MILMQLYSSMLILIQIRLNKNYATKKIQWMKTQNNTLNQCYRARAGGAEII